MPSQTRLQLMQSSSTSERCPAACGSQPKLLGTPPAFALFALDLAAVQKHSFSLARRIGSCHEPNTCWLAQVCMHFARKLLSNRTQWPLDSFMEAWQSSVPEVCMSRSSSCDTACGC